MYDIAVHATKRCAVRTQAQPQRHLLRRTRALDLPPPLRAVLGPVPRTPAAVLHGVCPQSALRGAGRVWTEGKITYNL